MAKPKAQSPFDNVGDLTTLLVGYVKQETVGPLRDVKRYLGFGLGGAILVGFGFMFLALAGLRALQTETGTTFTGSLSWLPYLIVLAVLALVIGVLGRMIKGGGSK